MQSNIDYLMVDGDFPDSWVELYNPSSSDADISGYYLGSKEDSASDYKLPHGTIVPANGHLVIYCDKEGNGLHADFRVDSGKAKLYLLDGSGSMVDYLSMSAMPAANIAYGRVADGAEEWQYELTPTAGSANMGGGASTVLPAPVFSISGGIYTEPVALTVSMPADVPADAAIYYTLNGEEPTADSQSGKEITMSIDQTTVVRAKILSASGAALPARSLVQSYIYHPRQVTLPVVSIVSNHKYFYDSSIGILTGNINDGIPNYMRKWRRPINIEYYDSVNSGAVFNQLGETAVSGVSTRENPQKSMKVYANKRFGKKNYKGNFWSEKPEVTKVKSFVLRNGGNNSFGARINDAAVQTLFGTNVDNLDWQAYRPVLVYLNGIYIGEFGMRERSDEDFVEANYDGLEDIELADETSYQSPVPGSLFESFRNDYMRADVTYEELASQMDMDNFIKTLIAEIYGMNTDFPTNNVSMWRPTAEGGKWRWILKDMDRFGANLFLYPSSFDMFRYMFDPDPLMYSGLHHFDLYKKLVTFPEFREAFVSTFLTYLNDFLRPSVVNGLVDDMQAEIRDEVKATFKKYNEDFHAFSSSTTYLKSVINERPQYILAQMKDFFNLDDEYITNIKASSAASSQSTIFTLCGTKINPQDALPHTMYIVVKPDGTISKTMSLGE